MLYNYECDDCKLTFDVVCDLSERHNQECPKCHGKNVDKLIGTMAVTGTRDNFGIGKSFSDDESGETIDNWTTWEKRGFRNPLHVTRDHDVKEKIKRKIDKIKHDKNKK